MSDTDTNSDDQSLDSDDVRAIVENIEAIESVVEEDVSGLVDRLEQLEASVEDPDERAEIRQARRKLQRLPGGDRVGKQIRKYTTRDVAEGFVGGVLLSLPLLVEDGVFEIAEWFTETIVAGVPVFLVANVLFVVLMVVGLLYWSDIRELQVSKPILGIVPRRLVGVLAISFVTAAFLLVLWGRHVEEDPTTLELFGRVTVIWAAAAFGAGLGDILPGESKGHDVTIQNVPEILGPD